MLNIGDKVKVYWNIRRAVWSVQHNGKVVGHANQVELEDVEFKVSEAGRQRVLREGVKNVHAFVVGNVKNVSWAYPWRGVVFTGRGWSRDFFEAIGADKRVSYNPRKAPTFVLAGQPVTKATMVAMQVNGVNPKVQAMGAR